MLLTQSYSDLGAGMRLLPAPDFFAVLRHAASTGHVAATSALLGTIGPPGSTEMCAYVYVYGYQLLHAAAVGTDASSAGTLALLLECYGPPGSRAVLEALAKGQHGVLRAACAAGAGSSVLALLNACGPKGGAAVLAALAADDFAPLSAAVESGRAAAVAAVIRAFGGARGALRCALEADDHRCLQACLGAFRPAGPGFEGDAILAALVAAYGEPKSETALRVLDAWLGEHPEILPAAPVDSALARLAVRTPAAWALLGDAAARTLLSAPARGQRALPVLLTLRWLPGGVAAPVGDFLRARPSLLFSLPAALPPE